MLCEEVVAAHESVLLPHGKTLAYRDLSGPPGAETVMLLHGIGVTADLNWMGSYATLRRRFRVVAPDLRGHGRSDSPSLTFRLEDCVDDVVALADSLGIDRFIAAGYSMGGVLAQLLWRRHPERVSRLVLCASARNFLGTPGERMAAMFGPAMTAAARMNPLWHTFGAGLFGPRLISDLNPELRQFALSEMNRTTMNTMTSALLAVSKFTSHAWIGDIDIPVSVLVTTRDTVVRPARQRRLAQAIPHAQVFTVDGDHGVCISDPDSFSPQLLAACLGGQPGSPG